MESILSFQTLLNILSKAGEEVVSDDNKIIVFLTFISATAVLAYATVANHPQLETLFISYCLIFSGLKVSKGIVDTIQKRKDKPNE